jgi:2-methylcitrate dehydratase
VLGLEYDLLPPEVVHQCKRSLLDAVACAVGALEAPAYRACLDFAKEFGGPAEATVIGSGWRTSAFNATLINSILVRFLDYNDMGGGCHNTDAIPNLLAVAERQSSSGREFITTLAASYELGIRIDMSQANWEGWVRDLRAAFTVPPALGRLMGMTELQIANAIGILGSGNLPLGILDVAGEERVMRKDLRFGWTACAGVVACMLAKHGFTGPVRVIEGDLGVNQVLFEGKMDLEIMTDFRGWHMVQTRHKMLTACSGLHGSIYATIAIVKENDIKPEDVAEVHVKVNGSDHVRPSIYVKYPRNAETADHSAFYTNAVAIVDRWVGPASKDPSRFGDPRIVDLIEKMTVSGDPSWKPKRHGLDKIYYTYSGFEGASEIVLKDGRRFQKTVTTPHGFGNDPLTDKELEDKFTDVARAYMSEKRMRDVIDTIWNLDKVTDMSQLMRLLVSETKN